MIAMVGDGANDAAALKRADVGIAVSTADDASRTVADVILLGGLDGFVSCVRAPTSAPNLTTYAMRVNMHGL